MKHPCDEWWESEGQFLIGNMAIVRAAFTAGAESAAPRMIPVTERLPDKAGDYLVESSDRIFHAGHFYLSDDGEGAWANEMFRVELPPVIGWCELPKRTPQAKRENR